MKVLYDNISYKCSKIVTKHYSTSFSFGIKMLNYGIRKHIYNIYGFVRLADEIVDSFHDFEKEILLKSELEELSKNLNQRSALLEKEKKVIQVKTGYIRNTFFNLTTSNY